MPSLLSCCQEPSSPLRVPTQPYSWQGSLEAPEVRREGREPLPDHAGESPLLLRSGGEVGYSPWRGLKESMGRD